MTLTYIIIDDEPKARKLLELYLSDFENLSFNKSFKSTVDAEFFLKDNIVDLIFLDVEMPEQLGTDFMRKFQPNAHVIFCTAYHKFAVDAFDLNAVDYLVKPITKKRLEKAVQKVVRIKQLVQLDNKSYEEDDIILLKRGRNKRLVNKSQILYVESAEDYVKYFLPDEMFMIKNTLKNVILELGDQFIQIHRSFVINKMAIHAIASNSVVLTNKHEIPLGRVYKSALKKVYLN